MIPKYKNMITAYKTVFLEEGIMRGLYSGYFAAMLGSLPSAAIFFGTYEFCKRKMIDEYELNETMSHLTSGFMGDFMSSFVYVPSEVLKTRLQLQGRFNNPYFQSGYNYRNLKSAISKIIQTEGIHALFFGYKATLVRDLPFSALQFAFYEKFRYYAFALEKKDILHDNLSLSNELITGACAGGLAGVITTPMDVLKTRLQTQLEVPDTQVFTPNTAKAVNNTNNNNNSNGRKPKQVILSRSIFQGLRSVYQSEGVIGLFSGVGPRFVWTSIQSSIMLVLYQMTLRVLTNSFDDGLL
ncbi:Mme1p NDAI_0H03220 [Naumovozyma dairenensis CBS 421]|uniref:Mitochondrial carrier protein n=1 Tax=Naumovozyma dairenensis (strain ATCC 10597 / BCRC 20456 / CBS 421 / NBRC 0211 / NRRL Y-12639) TaxID=1071378 RepID=G0WFD4_NAUDC|nr:hypothetical protein NDAI_0H03220 [Naumovozyma dairenensis CBS 421]CCD26495.1 hypothetical protein NDAI_0H03220 [Naumovozyma dairenensis CBS 421]